MASTTNSAMNWNATLEGRRIFVRNRVEMPDGRWQTISRPIHLVEVVLHRGEADRIVFRVSRPKGRLTFSDSRECVTGTAGTGGFFGTRLPRRPGSRKSLTPTAWKAEVARLIGYDQAEEIVECLSHR